MSTWKRSLAEAAEVVRHDCLESQDGIEVCDGCACVMDVILSIPEPPDLQAERAACMEEAAQACDPYRRYGGHVLIDGRLVSAAEAASIAIRALAPMPPGYVAVRTKDLEDVLFDTFEHVPPSLYNRLRAALTEDPNG